MTPSGYLNHIPKRMPKDARGLSGTLDKVESESKPLGVESQSKTLKEQIIQRDKRFRVDLFVFLPSSKTSKQLRYISMYSTLPKSQWHRPTLFVWKKNRKPPAMTDDLRLGEQDLSLLGDAHRALLHFFASDVGPGRSLFFLEKVMLFWRNGPFFGRKRYIPGPPNGWFLVVLGYWKASRNHLLGGPGTV